MLSMANNIIYPMGINLTSKIIDGKWKPSLICKLGIHDFRNGKLLCEMPEIFHKKPLPNSCAN